MKTALVFLAIIAVTAAAKLIDPLAADRSISSSVQETIEGMRDQMPCGFPGMGIPPMAPLKISHKEVNIDTETIKMNGFVDHFRLYGLNDFDVAEMKINALTSKATFRFIFRNVFVDTLYDLRVVLKKAGFTINLIGDGPAKVAIKDMHIFGTLKYSIGLLSGKLKLKTLEVRTHIGEVESDIEGMLGQGGINHKLNDVIAEITEEVVNSNEDVITETIEALALPVVNSALEDVTLADLVGGGGGEGGEKEACIPPADD